MVWRRSTCGRGVLNDAAELFPSKPKPVTMPRRANKLAGVLFSVKAITQRSSFLDFSMLSTAKLAIFITIHFPRHTCPGKCSTRSCSTYLFCDDTLILTARGAVPVQDLTTDDRVITASGRHRPITWIGKRQIIFHPNHLKSDWPVRVMARELGTAVRRVICFSPRSILLP